MASIRVYCPVEGNNKENNQGSAIETLNIEEIKDIIFGALIGISIYNAFQLIYFDYKRRRVLSECIKLTTEKKE